jgi:hypothetical protein
MFIAAIALTAALVGGGSNVGTATTHDVNVPDTTSISGPATVNSPYGPVWAYDNLERVVHITQTADGYQVVLNSHGTYRAFADPRTGEALVAQGSVAGEVTYQVTSPVAPDMKALPKQSNDLHSGDVLNALFQNQESVGSSSYHFRYMIGGENYSQDG